MPAVSRGADRDHRAKSIGGSGRDRGRRLARHARTYARDAGPLAFASRDTADDHVSSVLLAPQPGAGREAESLGRHAASPRAAGSPDLRKAAQLLSIGFRTLSWRQRRNSPQPGVTPQVDAFSNQSAESAIHVRAESRFQR